MAPASERLFIALAPAPPLRAALAAWRDAWQWPKPASLVADDKLHLTLHFLGDVASADIDALRAALDGPVAPFTIPLGAAALWHGGVAVLEPLAVPPELLALHARLAATLAGLGLPTETRPYRPHVTMARRAAGAVAPPAAALAWPVDSFALMASRAGVYLPLHTYGAAPRL